MADLKSDKVVACKLTVIFLLGSLICLLMVGCYAWIFIFSVNSDPVYFVVALSFSLFFEIASTLVLLFLLKVETQSSSKNLHGVLKVFFQLDWFLSGLWNSKKQRTFQNFSSSRVKDTVLRTGQTSLTSLSINEPASSSLFSFYSSLPLKGTLKGFRFWIKMVFWLSSKLFGSCH